VDAEVDETVILPSTFIPQKLVGTPFAQGANKKQCINGIRTGSDSKKKKGTGSSKKKRLSDSNNNKNGSVKSPRKKMRPTVAF